jgi:hypothetical protein
MKFANISRSIIVVILATSGTVADGPGMPLAIDPATGALRPPPIPSANRFGVAHMSPRYRPRGRLGPDVLVEGAEDAYRLGFRTIKVGMNSEVASTDWKYYALPAETLAPVKSMVDLAKLDVYRRLFAIPFQTFLIAADAVGDGNWNTLAAHPEPGRPPEPDRPNSPAARQQIYYQMYDLTKYLLTTYKGSGKVFVLQNHEADWHTLPTPDEKLDPSDIALMNMADYLSLRQQAVNKARREVGDAGVYVYHLAEVCFVLKSMSGRRTVANNVLPGVECDLVGYSAWETASRPGGEFLQAVAFLKTKARDSFAFGNDNVAITEVGVHEKTQPDFSPEFRAMLEGVAIGMPWVIQWALYDNECFRMEDGKQVAQLDAREDQCNGQWVRKPDGGFGRLFMAYRPYLVASPGAPEAADSSKYVDQVYRLALGRSPDALGGFTASQLIEAKPWEKETVFTDLVFSPEYKARTGASSAALVFDAYRVLFGRNPEPAAAPSMESDLRADAPRKAYIEGLLATDESRARYIDWLYRRYLDRPATPAEADRWLADLRRGQTRRQVFEAFATSLPVGR